MKTRKLAYRLSFIHLIHYLVIFIAMLLTNFLLLKFILTRDIVHKLKVRTECVEGFLDSKLDDIEQFSLEITTLLNHDEGQFVSFANQNPLVASVNQRSINDSGYYPIDSIEWKLVAISDNEFHCSLIRQISSTQQLVIELIPDWINRVNRYHNLDGSLILCFSPQNSVVYSSGLHSYKTPHTIHVEKLLAALEQKNITSIYDEGVGFKQIQLLENGDGFMSYVKYNRRLNFFISANTLNRSVFSSLGHYPAMIGIIGVVFFLLTLFFVIRINLRYTKPYSDIIQGLQQSQFVKLNIKSTTSEPLFIKRSIDLLQNQLDFYIKNLEKSSNETLKIEKDLKIAKRLQHNILPQNRPEISRHPEFNIYAISEAVFDIGGDLYDYFMLDDHHLLFVVGDVAGKGIPAALFMIYTQTLLRSFSKPGRSVTEIIDQLNNKLIEENISDLFVTMLLGVLDTHSGMLSYSNAAHNFPLLIQKDGTIKELQHTHGIPLGIYSNRSYQSTTIQLEDDDQLLIYTDGVVDTIDENGMSYSVDVLKYNLMGAWFVDPEETTGKIKESIVDFRGSIAPVDDLTLLMLRFNHRVIS